MCSVQRSKLNKYLNTQIHTKGRPCPDIGESWDCSWKQGSQSVTHQFSLPLVWGSNLWPWGRPGSRREAFWAGIPRGPEHGRSGWAHLMTLGTPPLRTRCGWHLGTIGSTVGALDALLYGQCWWDDFLLWKLGQQRQLEMFPVYTSHGWWLLHWIHCSPRFSLLCLTVAP